MTRRATSDATGEKWDAYPRTVLEFPRGTGGCARIDLRHDLDDSAHAALVSLGLDMPFAVFTAQNPRGDNADDAPTDDVARAKDAANRIRESALERALRDRGIAFRPVDGVAPDGSYRERCVAAVMDRETAVRLATELQQLALFWFDGARFWLLPAAAPEPPEILPKR